jgi:hypothetical protein
MALIGHVPQEGPWNPGLGSTVPAAYRHLASLLKSESIANSLSEIDELSGFCGLQLKDLVEFRAERLIEHEVLIRMTADVEVADGPNSEDLGITFRAMVRRVLETHVTQHMWECKELLKSIRSDARACVLQQLRAKAEHGREARSDRPTARWRTLWRASASPTCPPPGGEAGDLERLRRWQHEAGTAGPGLARESLFALVKVATALAGRHGRIIGDPALIADIAARQVCNDYGSARLGAHIEKAFRTGVLAEGYRLLPVQAEPYVINIKGASASGKSSMRPLQRALAARLCVPWSDFSLISPDIWRKFLLNYESLGPAYKYAGALSAQELEIVDRKLDIYIARKAASGQLTHLLIDRFRFDSFRPEADVQVSSRLLTRFASHVFLHFMITPPEATVERAWDRGKRVGRYKAIDDLLAHNIEAYSGIPELFFTWALSRSKRVHYEFLDNSVRKGQTPRTVAFGINGEMIILDVGGMLDVERYRHININATCPSEVYLPPSHVRVDDLAFLRRCVALLPVVKLANRQTGEIYARFEAGALTHLSRARLEAENAKPGAKGAIEALLSRPVTVRPAAAEALPRLDPAAAHTIGAWGKQA